MTFTPPVIPPLDAIEQDLFPNNVLSVLADSLQDGSIPEVTGVLYRPLRASDPTFSLGIFPTDWAPDEIEIGTIEPTLTTYTFQIQSLVIAADEQEGRQWGSYLAKSVRLVLYRNETFAVPLRQLREIRPDGSIERCQRFGIKRQKFAANILNGQLLHFSGTEFWVQTESA